MAEKVWMAHMESGSYSDWEYDVLGIFSSHEKAAEYVKGLAIVRSDGTREAPTTSDGTYFSYSDSGAFGKPWMYVTEYTMDVGKAASELSDYVLGREKWDVKE